MAEPKVPAAPANSFRITLDLSRNQPRIDKILLDALRAQSGNLALREISRTDFKELFKRKRILIKGQPATPASALASGITHVDILGYTATGTAPPTPRA